MTRSLSLAATASVVALAACASYPMPAQRLADAEAAARSAQDTGVASNPQAQLHLRLAQEEIARAKQLVQDGDNKRADYVLIRAKSDAELALAEARDQQAQTEAQKAMQQVADLRATGGAGAAPTTAISTTISTATPTTVSTTTTTTSGTTPAPTPTTVGGGK